MSVGSVNFASSKELVHPRLRVQLYPLISDGRCDGDGNPVEPQWGPAEPAELYVPMEMTWASNGQPSTLAFRLELGGRGAEFERLWPENQFAPMGARVKLLDVGGNVGFEWFAGVIGLGSTLIQADPDAEHHVVTAYGPELRLAQGVVTGRWYASGTVEDKVLAGTRADSDFVRDNVVATDLSVVFNADGRPDCLSRLFDLRADLDEDDDLNRSAGVFCQPDRYVILVIEGGGEVYLKAVRWTAYAALRALVDWFDAGTVISPTGTNWDVIAKTLAGVELGTVDVDGLGLTDAIRAVLRPIGFGFALEPFTWGDNWQHRLLVYPLKNPTVQIRPHLPRAGSSLDARDAEVQRIHFIRDNHRVANEVTVYGALERVQVQLAFRADEDARDLWPCWDTSTYDLADYENGDNEISLPELSADQKEVLQRRYSQKGDQHDYYRHVWRSFCWNEDGSFSQFAQAGGSPVIPDPATQFGMGRGDICARIGRPIGDRLEYADETRAQLKPPRVWIAVLVESNTAEVDITGRVTIWKDRAGLTIDDSPTPLFAFEGKDGFDVVCWKPFEDSDDPAVTDELRDTSYLTLLHNTLRGEGTPMAIRIEGSIADDRCTRGRAKRRIRSSWPSVAQKVIRNESFRLWRIPGVSGDIDRMIADDTAAAQRQALAVRDAAEDQMGHGSIVVPSVTMAYRPGMGIPATSGRVMSLHVDGGDRDACPVIDSVRFVFGETNTTELLLDSPMVGLAG